GDKNIELTTYYRADEEICEILDYVSANVETLPQQQLNRLLSLFKKYKVTMSSTEVRRRYLSHLETLVQRVEANNSDENCFLLATLISAASHLFTSADWQGDLRLKMLECLKLGNRRVIANTLDVFGDLDPMAGEEVFQDLMALNDNRIAANSLVKEGKREWNKRTSTKLDRMMKVQSPYFKASALYALGEIAQHLKRTDPVAFTTDDQLEKKLAQLPAFAFHANPMVRRQALKAVDKCERTEQLEKAFKTNQGKLDQAVRADVIAYLTKMRAQSDALSQSEESAAPKLKVV
ncbi:MAG: hypothetical protein V4692_10965, partial [Bdellovibrionota bacterium]